MTLPLARIQEMSARAKVFFEVRKSEPDFMSTLLLRPTSPPALSRRLSAFNRNGLHSIDKMNTYCIRSRLQLTFVIPHTPDEVSISSFALVMS